MTKHYELQLLIGQTVQRQHHKPYLNYISMTNINLYQNRDKTIS